MKMTVKGRPDADALHGIFAKSSLIFLPLFFHGSIFSAPEKMVAAAIGFAAFSLSASAIYALNDCRDAPQDRQHLARKVPVAAGGFPKRRR